MHRFRQILARKLEARNRQLQIGVREKDHGVEETGRHRTDAHSRQAVIHVANKGHIARFNVPGDCGVFFALGVVLRRRQAQHSRRAVVALPRQKHDAAGDDDRAICPWPEQHRIGSEERGVGHDHIGRKIPQDLLDTLVLRGNRSREDLLEVEGHALRRRQGFALGEYCVQVSQIIVVFRRKRPEYRADAFNAVAHHAGSLEQHLVALLDQNTPDRQHRVQVTREGGAGNENFHVIISTRYVQKAHAHA